MIQYIGCNPWKNQETVEANNSFNEILRGRQQVFKAFEIGTIPVRYTKFSFINDLEKALTPSQERGIKTLPPKQLLQ